MLEFIKKLWLPLLIIAAIVAALILIPNPLQGLFYSEKITLEDSDAIVAEVKGIGQLVTAEYYGESIASLSEVYKHTSEQGLKDAYEAKRAAFLSIKGQYPNKKPRWLTEQFKKSNKQKSSEFSLLKNAAGKNLEESFLNDDVAELDWTAFFEKYNANVTRAIAQYQTTNKRGDLVYIGRGWVRAGYDLNKLTDEDFKVSNDTLIIYDLSAEVLDADINPWFIPGKVPGYQLFLNGKNKAVKSAEDLTEVNLVKIECRKKLVQDAIAMNLLDSAKNTAEETLESFMSLLQDADNPVFRHVAIVPSKLSLMKTNILDDFYIDSTEVVNLKQQIHHDTTFSLKEKRVVLEMNRTTAESNHHYSWNDLVNAAGGSDSTTVQQ